jgi:hypothetical protein
MHFKRKHLIVILLSIINIITLPATHEKKTSNQPVQSTSFPDSIDCTIQTWYRHRPDGFITLDVRG